MTGRLHINRKEVEERRRRGKPQPLDTRELFSDEAVLDLYMRGDVSGWRISATTFDFSCLGSAKALTAFENLSALVDVLRERAGKVEVDDTYSRVRPLLRNVWQLETNTRKGGWRRSGAGKFEMSTVTTTDNEAQFNNYSRLLCCLKLRELESSK